MKILFQLALFISVACGVLFGFFRLKQNESALMAEVSHLESRHGELVRVKAETDELNEKLRVQFSKERECLARITNACRQTNSLSNFPVRSDEFVVYKKTSKGNQFEFSYYVPKGDHLLRLNLRDIEICPSVGGGFSTNWSQAKPTWLDFPLAPESVGRFELRIVTEDEKAHADLKLIDSDGKLIEQRRADLGERTLEGIFENSSSGNNIRLPGQVSPIMQSSGSYETTIFKMENTEKGMRCLESSVSILSPKSQVFLRDKDVVYFFEGPSRNSPVFDERYQRDEKTGLLVPSEQEKEKYRWLK